MGERSLTLRLQVDSAQSTQALRTYQEQLSRTEQIQRNLSDSAQNVTSYFGDLNSMLGTLGIGLSALGIGKAILEFNELGDSINDARTTFEAFGGSDAAIESLRQSTHGLVSELDLMQEASKFTSQGLVETADQAGELISVARDLALVFQVDGKDAVESFYSALSTGRVNALRNLGIDIQEVKRRAEELGGGTDAMRQAILEAANATRNELNPAVEANIDNVDILAARWEDIKGIIGVEVNNAIEDAAGRMVDLMDLYNERREEAVEIAGREADMTERIVASLQGEGIQGGQPADFIALFVHQALMDAQNDPSLWNDLDAFRNQILMELGAQGINTPGGEDAADSMRTWLMFTAQRQASIEAEQIASQELDRIYTDIEDRRAAAAREIAQQTQAQRVAEQNLLDIENMRAQRNEDIANATRDARMYDELRAGALGGLQSQTLEASTGLFRQGMTSEGMGFVPTQQYMTEADVYRLQQAALFADQQVEYMKELEDAHGDAVFSDADIQAAEGYAEQIHGMADDAQQAADAAQRMRENVEGSLQGLTGQTGGGTIGDINEIVQQRLEARGIDTTKFQESGAMFSGEETAASQYMQGPGAELLAQIYQQYGQEAYQTAVDNLIAGVEAANMAGLSDEEKAAIMPQLTGFVPNSLTPQMGPNQGGIPGTPQLEDRSNLLLNPETAANFDPEQFIASMDEAQSAMSEIVPDISTTATQSGMFADHMELAQGHIRVLRQDMEQVAETVRQLTSGRKEILIVPRIDAHQLHLALASELSWFQLNLR